MFVYIQDHDFSYQVSLGCYPKITRRVILLPKKWRIACSISTQFLATLLDWYCASMCSFLIHVVGNDFQPWLWRNSLCCWITAAFPVAAGERRKGCSHHWRSSRPSWLWWGLACLQLVYTCPSSFHIESCTCSKIQKQQRKTNKFRSYYNHRGAFACLCVWGTCMEVWG